jgi:membrane protease YdiL (CAAX protease family)
MKSDSSGYNFDHHSEKMKQMSNWKILWYHLYPGLLLTAFFIGTTILLQGKGIPPQLILLLGIPLVIVPVMYFHLLRAKERENRTSIGILVGSYTRKLSAIRLAGYSFMLIVFAFAVYGITQPINVFLTEKLLFWLPDWYKIQSFEGYPGNIILITLIANLVLNGFVAPFIEEVYFRGYLLPRMGRYGKWAPLMSTVLFSFYHFWQPQIYVTLIIALFPMVYYTWKTQDLRLAIYTHCGLNVIGALLSFALIMQEGNG